MSMNLVVLLYLRSQNVDKANCVKSCARANTCKTTPVNENKILAAYTPRN